MTSWPISYYAAKYNVDVDLLTRGAGFGYIGSTITSLIYASFTFILLAFEAAIMAMALELALNIPLSIGYLISALVILPLVVKGIGFINKVQAYTQPLWLILLVLPWIVVLWKQPHLLSDSIHFAGAVSASSDFNLYYFGAACTLIFVFVIQIGEQADYLRFCHNSNKPSVRGTLQYFWVAHHGFWRVFLKFAWGCCSCCWLINYWFRLLN